MIHSIRLWRSDLMWHLAYSIGETRHHAPYDSFRAALAALDMAAAVAALRGTR